MARPGEAPHDADCDPSFFAYKRPSGANLEQGDVVAQDNDIRRIIEQVHPYYLKKDYEHFLILTQSCDLVRREHGKCNARYITLAAVRPLSTALGRKIAQFQNDFTTSANVCKISVRPKVADFLERLLNNNEPGYFYLHEQSDFKFPESSCAFLHLSIALKVDHYDRLLSARRLSLEDVFQAKLGWLVGNIYSRIGTPDWVPGYHKKEEFDKHISRLLEQACRWHDDKVLDKARREWLRREPLSTSDTTARKDAIREIIKSVPSLNRRNEVLEVIKDALLASDALSDPASVDAVVKLVAADERFKAWVK